MPYAPKDATPTTAATSEHARVLYALDDVEDFDTARRGKIADIPAGKVLLDDGSVAYDESTLAFLDDDAARSPDTVNPSLWRQSQVIHEPGLYKVVDRLYQVRNNDIGNRTIVEGDDGLVVIDCTTGVEVAQQGLALFREHVADRPVVAVIYTHTHIDHYGGVKGVVDEADVASGKVPIIAPGTIASFDKFAIGENVVAGNAMSRRAAYAFGNLLVNDAQQMITCGIASIGGHGITVSYISPADPITETGQVRSIAGLTFEFLYAPDTEAPEEMHIWIPELKALTCAENANQSLHNIQTLRGARTRDARNFARYLDETIVRWGDEVEVHFGPTHGRSGATRRSSPSWSPSATPTSTSTTRPCGSRTRDTRPSRPQRSSSCPRRCAGSGSTGATTARCTTTCGRCSPGSWACGTATRCRCTPTPRSTPRRVTSQPSGATRSSPRGAARSTRATTAGRRRSSTTSSSPIRTTVRPRTSWPTPTSSSDTRRRVRSGAASTSRRRASCARE
ncbi:hypothetical protein Slu03_12250 [Sediminihabitans luteus]|nr:MBL fold metallo-hydrolase [Sediminihabitans luteus]GII98847.1 hypothetical protein Slu03_12250 [Sediminihabitans luteus]